MQTIKIKYDKVIAFAKRCKYKKTFGKAVIKVPHGYFDGCVFYEYSPAIMCSSFQHNNFVVEEVRHG